MCQDLTSCFHVGLFYQIAWGPLCFFKHLLEFSWKPVPLMTSTWWSQGAMSSGWVHHLPSSRLPMIFRRWTMAGLVEHMAEDRPWGVPHWRTLTDCSWSSARSAAKAASTAWYSPSSSAVSAWASATAPTSADSVSPSVRLILPNLELLGFAKGHDADGTSDPKNFSRMANITTIYHGTKYCKKIP